MTTTFITISAMSFRVSGRLARLGAVVAVLLLTGLSDTPAQTPSVGAAGIDAALLEDMVIGSRILADFGVLDGFGHVSARHPTNPNRFLMARSLAPALVTADDIMEFDLEGNAVDARGRTVFLERFIHSEIYKARPDVMGVVHTHSAGVIPFSVTNSRAIAMRMSSSSLIAWRPSEENLPSMASDTSSFLPIKRRQVSCMVLL